MSDEGYNVEMQIGPRLSQDLIYQVHGWVFIFHLPLTHFPLEGRLFDGHLCISAIVSSILATLRSAFLRIPKKKSISCKQALKTINVLLLIFICREYGAASELFFTRDHQTDFTLNNTCRHKKVHTPSRRFPDISIVD